MIARRFIGLASLAALGACTVGPNYRPPADGSPPRFAEPVVPAPAAAPPVDLENWWTAFNDPELDRLIAIALQDAPDIRTAASRIREARLSVVVARSAGLPQVNAQAQGQYERFEHGKATVNAGKLLGTLPPQAGGAAAGAGVTLPPNGKVSMPLNGSEEKTYSAGFDATWELDLFGGVRRQVEAARAQEEAAEYNAQDAAVSLSAEVANDYLQLRLAQQRYHVVQGEIARQQRSLQILEETAKVGLVPQTNFIRQRTQLASVQAELPPLVAQAKTQIHAIAILIGHTPTELFDEIATERQPATPPPVPPGLPSELLRRRPDVRAAERQLAAATASIGVAVADLYPRISLTGMAQFASLALGGILSAHEFQFSAAGSGTFPILDWGRRRATVGQRQEEREQAYISYQQTVLGAFRDVDDALARLDSDRVSLQVLTGGVADADRSAKAVFAQFQVGLVNFDAVLTAQQQVLQVSDQLAQAQGQQRQDLVSLYKALGGGWNPAAKPVVPPRPDRDHKQE